MIKSRAFKASAAALSTLGIIGLPSMGRTQAPDYEKIQILVEKVAPGLYALTGSPGLDPGHPEAAGGRIGALVGPEGVFLVDAQYAPLTGKVVDAIRTVSSAPIRFLVNTHEHPDHTGGNSNFVKLGALLFAREEAYQEMAIIPPPPVIAAVGRATDFKDPSRLPTITYGMGSTIKIRFDGETVDLIPLPPAHTAGDTLVRFEKADVIMVGDIYRNYGYPFVDQTNGGTFRGLLEALNMVTQLSGERTKLIPGHGSIVGRSDISGYRDMILDVRSAVQRMVADHRTLNEVLAAKLTRRYDASVPGGLDSLPAGLGTSADRFVRSLYTELAGAK